MPRGSNSGGYGGNGVRFPDWVYQLGNAFGIKPSTYPGHQESDRREAGYAPNPQRLNRGIDWASPRDPAEIDKLTRFADYLATIPQHLEQVIWQNPRTMRSIEIAGGRHQPGYFRNNLPGHRNHVHTRQSAPIPLPDDMPPPPIPTDRRAEILARAVGNMTVDRAREILPGVANGLRDSICTNVNRIAMWIAQMGHESANFRATEEFASGAAYEGRCRDLGNCQPGDGVRFKGRTWIQITGRTNYTKLSSWAHSKGIIPTPTFFVDNSVRLAEMQYAGLGPAWYWTVARPQINSMCDVADLIGVTKAINGGTNGLEDRRNRWFRALALGNELLTLVSGEEDELSAETERMIRELHALYVTDQLESLSSLKRPGEGKIANIHLFLRWMDGNIHILTQAMLATLGNPETLSELRQVAESNEPGRDLARAILAESNNPVPVSTPRAATPVSTPEPVEILPAIREPDIESSGNTPEDLLGVLDRLDKFNRDYRKKFNKLTSGSEKEEE